MNSIEKSSKTLVERLRAALQYHVDSCCAMGCDYCREDRALLREADETKACIWDDCDQEAVYCPGHAREFVQGEPPAVKADETPAPLPAGCTCQGLVTTDGAARIRFLDVKCPIHAVNGEVTP